MFFPGLHSLVSKARRQKENPVSSAFPAVVFGACLRRGANFLLSRILCPFGAGRFNYDCGRRLFRGGLLRGSGKVNAVKRIKKRQASSVTGRPGVFCEAMKPIVRAVDEQHGRIAARNIADR